MVVANTVLLLTQQVVFGEIIGLPYSTFSKIFEKYVRTDIGR